LLRESIIKELGMEKARKLFLRFGYQHGYADCMQMKINYEFDNEIELLATGPTIHSWEGIVKATPLAMPEFDREKGTFLFKGTWTNSYEAEQHLSSREASKDPVCWTLMGYASGYGTAFFGSPVIAIEQACVGMGNDHCEWWIQPPSVWGNKAVPYLEALKDLTA
jgi:hypothetical protein